METVEPLYEICAVFCKHCGIKDRVRMLGDAKLKNELARLACTFCARKNVLRLCKDDGQ